MYIPLERLEKKVPKNDYNKGAIEMLKLIAKIEGREDEAIVFFKVFFADVYNED